MRGFAAWLVLWFAVPAWAGSRDEQWKKVDEAVGKGLPKTAIEHLEPIIAGAMQDKAYAEALKAIAKKIALEGSVEGNKPEEKIVRMKAEIAKAPQEMVPVLDAILANWYWHYFQQNRWRFLQRTATAQSPGDDFTTWDLPRILAEIDKQFSKALAGETLLKATPVSAYDELLQKGSVPDSYRPTMFDFLAHNALEFYAAGEQAGAKAEDAFDLLAASPIFAPADEFLGWELPRGDESSVTLKAIRLYQSLLRFHQADADKTAWIDADLLRLNFGFNKAFGEEKNARYKAALQRFTDQWGDHEIAARALHDWATVLQQEGDLVAAHQLAERGQNAFPQSVGGRRCHNLRLQIEAKSSQISIERVWNQPLGKIQVRYRNLTKAFFRIVPDSYEARLKSTRNRPEQLDEGERQALLAKPPVRHWSVELPPTDDYQERIEEVAPPADLKPGSYFLVASHDADFGLQNNVVSFSDFWVSDLALVVRSRHGEAKLEGFVLNAIYGEPLAGAQVQAWYRARNEVRQAGPTAKTDANGLFTLATVANQACLLVARHQDQMLATAGDYAAAQADLRTRPTLQTVFFSDRSLYRPGQTIQYKGICLDVDQERDNYQTLAGRVLTVVFADGNNKEIARQQHQTNAYGSFSGSFTAPRDRVTGRMSIRVDGEPAGATSFNVEEYKRPKFQVAVERPELAPKLNGEVAVKGRATAYTGAAINEAQIRYRVVRQVRYPSWWGWYFWWRMPPAGDAQEITHGRAVTAADGSFEVKFVARPDLSVSEQDEPVFEYTVYADVTDTTGETRSGQQTLRVGYTALQATLTADEWQTADKPIQLSIQTSTLDGEGQLAEGSLKIHRLKAPDKVQRQDLSGRPDPRVRFRGGEQAAAAPEPNPSDPNSWPLGDVVAEHGWTTDAGGHATFACQLPAGAYRAVLETQDRFNKKVTAQLPLRVVDPAADKFAVKIPYALAAPTWSVEPGQEFLAVWGSGYDQARAFVEIEHRSRTLKSFWTDPKVTQAAVKQAVTEAMRGGFTLHVTMVRENRAYTTSRKVGVPWSNKQLSVKWEHFTSKLEPGQKETWTLTVGPAAIAPSLRDANPASRSDASTMKAAAEMVAALYDASLDAYQPHSWPARFNVFREDHSRRSFRFENMTKNLQHLPGGWPQDYQDASLSYRSFPADIIANLWGYQFFGRNRGGFGGGLAGGLPPPMAAAPGGMPQARRAMAIDRLAAEPEMAAAAADKGVANFALAEGLEKKPSAGLGADAPPPPAPDLSKVSARQNLNETAFFFPQLLTDDAGRVKLEFTMPEALTEWKFLGFAHDTDLRSGWLQDKVVTAKDLMVQPNPPRFLREGDVLEFTVKVSNQSPARQTGTVRLTLADARTGEPADAALGNTTTDQPFDIAAKESRSLSWRLTVPDGAGFLTYKAVGSTGKLSDGEEGFLPVLSRRILVTESLPLPIRGAQTKQFQFSKLLDSGRSDTLRHQSLTVQMVSNPSWYAVLALPYLMEFPHECTEQTFNRLYANALARHIANSDPQIRRVFDQWKGAPALDSPLEKNQDLKAVLIEETPWLRQAQAESQARRNVGVLFDDNRLSDEMSRGLRKLTEQQLADGRWPWFPGGPPNEYITLYITTGFGRLRHLSVDIDVAPAVKSLDRLDAWIDEQYREILKWGKKDEYHLSPTIALYLYGRSFFLEDKPIDAKYREAVDYFQGQARKYWLQLANRQSQAHLAIALKRFGDAQTPQDIMRSIKERSVSSEELGLFWREQELSWWWYRAPIETQAMMIEAFDEVMNDAAAVEDCKVWLLKQKQTQDWKTTKATADAVYGLLLRGTDLLASKELVQVTLGGTTIEPESVEAGTGYYEQRFSTAEIKPQMGEITVKKLDAGVAWGSVHWQYLEDMTKVTPYEGTPLKLQKQLFTKVDTSQGPKLEPVAGPVKVGDELVTRVVVRVDRDMEYVHLKDYRGSGTEPVNVLSRYKYQDGLAYYEATRDTASHFFIDYLPKGVYVFEYSVRVQHKGAYQTGMAEIQCMYAPEFNSHSESLTLTVE